MSAAALSGTWSALTAASRRDASARVPFSIGGCRVGDGSIVAQGVSVIGRDTPGRCLVFQGAAGALNFVPPRRDILADFFRDVPPPDAR